MHIWRALAAALAVAGFAFAPSAAAHSTQRNRLRSVAQINDAVLVTPSHRVHALSSFDLTFSLPNRSQQARLSLAPNHDILAEDATVQIIGPDGAIRSIEHIDRLEHRIYRGHVFTRSVGDTEWRDAGWARINVHRDGVRPVFEGAFRLGSEHHHIQTVDNYRQTMVDGDPELDGVAGDALVLWRDSDIVGSAPKSHGSVELKREALGETGCSSDELLYNRDQNNLVYRGLNDSPITPWYHAVGSVFGRQMDGTTGSNGAGVNLSSTIGSTAGCPTTRKVALVGVAADCNYVAQFNSTSSVRANIIQQINSASSLYESSFNISLGIQNLTITEAGCPATAPSATPWNVACSDGVTITDRLNLFSAWRGQRSDTNAYWTLLSTCNTGAAVGLAWLGELCKQGSQTPTSGTSGSTNETIAGANVVVRTSTEWQVIAHETAHTFGAVHDCTSGTCSDGTAMQQQCCPLSSTTCNANGGYIMNPSTGTSITAFSPCTIGNICSFLGRNTANMGCLANNKDVTTLQGSQCGNGIVETGEDCDCGGATDCANNTCCDPKTCKFTTNSVCDPSNEECCTGTCQYASQGTVCRKSAGNCDPQEVCSGTSGSCPANSFAPDGTSCASGASPGTNMTCASGQCTSRDLQCKVMMGSLTTKNETYSCSSQGCTLSCASPDFGANTCLSMRQNFLDGTPCEGGGKCRSGACQGATLGNEITSWIGDNKNIVIPVAAVVGFLFLFALLGCCITFLRRRSDQTRRRPAPPPSSLGPMKPRMPRTSPPPYMASPEPPPHAWMPTRPRGSSFRYA